MFHDTIRYGTRRPLFRALRWGPRLALKEKPTKPTQTIRNKPTCNRHTPPPGADCPRVVATMHEMRAGRSGFRVDEEAEDGIAEAEWRWMKKESMAGDDGAPVPSCRDGMHGDSRRAGGWRAPRPLGGLIPAICLALIVLVAEPTSGIPIRPSRAEGGKGDLSGGGEVAPVGDSMDVTRSIATMPSLASSNTTSPPPAPRPEFDKAMALYLLNHSRVTYCDDQAIGNWTCAICRDPSMRAFRPYYVTGENKRHVFAYVGYAADRNMAIVVFRGTTFLANWIQDLEYYKMDSKYGECGKNKSSSAGGAHEGDEVKTKCMVHSGFYDDWLSVRDDVLVSVKKVLEDHPTAATWVTGHSLGGALAAFSALEVSLMLQSKDVGMYSFGEPRIGNKFFAEFWGEWVPRGMRVVHTDDVVPHLPPRGESILLLTDFHHTSTEVWQSGPKEDEYIVCDGTGEDPTCSDSLQYWDRSIAAHLIYMGYVIPGCLA